MQLHCTALLFLQKCAVSMSNADAPCWFINSPTTQTSQSRCKIEVFDVLVAVCFGSVCVNISNADRVMPRLVSDFAHIEHRNHLSNTAIFEAVKLVGVGQSKFLPYHQPFASQYLVRARLLRRFEIVAYQVVIIWKIIDLQINHIAHNVFRYRHRLRLLILTNRRRDVYRLFRKIDR